MSDQFETAKEVAGKSIGKHGLAYITAIIVISVVASIFLDEGKIAAVIGMAGGAIMAIINMMNGVSGTTEKEEKPEFQVIQKLIEQSKEPMSVTVEGNKVTVSKGSDSITTQK
jgi:Sec-independent protein translocase protein TatA